MAVVNKDLGVVTAYAYAVQGGYVGTEAEFTEALGQAGIIVQDLSNLSAVAVTLAEGSQATASYSDGVLTFGIPKGDTGEQGPQGETGATGATGNGIASIAKTGTAGLVDTYTITFTNGQTTTFTVTNGADGDITNVAAAFDATKNYAVGDMVLYQGTLYAFTAAHSAGAWIGTDAQAVVLSDVVTDLRSDLNQLEGAFTAEDGELFLKTSNIGGMKETNAVVDSDNLFSSDLLYQTGKYPYISATTGKVVYGTNAEFNTYIIPVSGNVYDFTYISYGVLLDSDQETAVGSWIQNVTSVDTTGASYLAFAFRPTTYTPENYTIIEKLNVWEMPKTWAFPDETNKIMTKTGSIGPGDSFSIANIGTALKDGYTVIFKGFITSFTEIKLGFDSATNAITIDSTNVTIKNGYGADVVTAHGLTISNELSIIFDIVEGVANISVESNGGVFKTEVDWVQLNASNGTPTIISTGSVLTNCTLNVVFNSIDRPIWYLGDSYISVESANRWTYYLKQYKWFSESLFQGAPGMYSSSNVTAVQRMLKIKKPKIIVLSSGMNDGTDSSNAPNTNWANARNNLIAICQNNGIELVFGTIPTVPSINNEEKNSWIRSSGYRYIDFAKAVGADGTGAWYTGMLGGDNIHPTASGAKAMFTQAITDLPELITE